MKALEKDRNRRYETANELARDVDRYLHDEPVLACPPGAGYRIRKFVLRNRGRLFTIAVIGLTILVLIAAMAWAAWDRHTRSIQRVNEKSARAAVLSAQLRGILSDIARLEEQQAWPQALAAARRAETAVEVGEGDTEIAATVRWHVAELEFVERLEAARSIRDVDAGHSNYDEMARVLAPGVAGARPIDAGLANFGEIERAYNEAFAAFGVDLKNLSTAAASTRLRQAPGILQPVAAALDDWAAARRDKAHPGARQLSELVLAIDDDPFRREIRQAILSQNVETLHRLGKEMPKTPQPAATLWLIGMAQPTTNERAEVLMHAQVEYPADFWINFHLGHNLIHSRPPQPDHGARFLQAALALRPSSRARAHLGHVLVRLNRREEAEAVIRKGLSLNPGDASLYWRLVISTPGSKSVRRPSQPSALPLRSTRASRLPTSTWAWPCFTLGDSTKRLNPAAKQSRSIQLPRLDIVSVLPRYGDEAVPRVVGRVRDGEEARPRQHLAGQRYRLYD